MTDDRKDKPSERRAGCCADWPKPCSYHEGYIDGWDGATDEWEPMFRDMEAIAKKLQSRIKELTSVEAVPCTE